MATAFDDARGLVFSARSAMTWTMNADTVGSDQGETLPLQHQQDRLWDYYQNRAIEQFEQSEPRLRFLCQQIRPPAAVLDIGVGAGTFERLALQRGLEVFCLDPNPRTIEAIRDRFGLGERARVGYGQDIPFPDERFDAVVVSEVLEHLDDQALVATLRESARVLKPGGVLLGTVPARENLQEQRVVCPCCGATFHRWGHRQSFTVARLRELLAPAFDVVAIGERPFESWRHLNRKGRLLAVARRLLSAMGIRGRGEHIWFRAVKRC